MAPTNTTWTKADIARMQAGLDRAHRRAVADLTVASDDAHRERVNARLHLHATDFVCEHLHRLVADGVDADAHAVMLGDRVARPRVAEGRAAARLLVRLKTSPLPVDLLTMPAVALQRLTQDEQASVNRFAALGLLESAAVVVMLAAERRENAEAAARVETVTTPVAVPTYSVDTDRDRRSIEANLADVVTGGRVEVHSADSDAFNTDTPWGDVEQRVAWEAWTRPAATRRSAERGLDRCVAQGASTWSPSDVLALRSLWAFACAEEPLPEVLDLRGAPESHGVLVEPWRLALAEALRHATRGVVILVQREAWALARLLPSRVGRSS